MRIWGENPSFSTENYVYTKNTLEQRNRTLKSQIKKKKEVRGKPTPFVTEKQEQSEEDRKS